MTNRERRQLLDRFRASGMEGSILDVYQAYGQGRDLIAEHYEQQQEQEPVVLTTPQEQQQGLRPYHAAGDMNRSAVFKDVPPHTPFNTHGMSRPINIEKYDEQGHLVESHKSIPPGISNIPTGPHRGDVIETPAEGYRDGGFVKKMQGGGFTEELSLEMGGARQRWRKMQNGGPKDDPNEAAMQELKKKQQAYLDALAASGIPFTGDESFDKDFVGYTKTQGSAEGLDKRYADLDRLHNDFYEEAKRLKELGLVRQIRAQKNYYTAPAYSDGLGGTIQQQHGTRYDVYDIVLPPKREPLPPAPERLEKRRVEPIDRIPIQRDIILPPGPPPPVELPEVTVEAEGEIKDRRKSRTPRRNRMYRRTLSGKLVPRKRKFRNQDK